MLPAIINQDKDVLKKVIAVQVIQIKINTVCVLKCKDNREFINIFKACHLV